MSSSRSATTCGRAVQADRRSKQVLDEDGVRAKFGVAPSLIPDYLALVGDAADGYPGIPGIGSATAARLINRYGPIDAFPEGRLGDRLELALLFRELATLRTDAALFDDVDTLRWRGPGDGFDAMAERLGDTRLGDRARKARDGAAAAGA
jgi:5'-3' exonuclease